MNQLVLEVALLVVVTTNARHIAGGELGVCEPIAALRCLQKRTKAE